LSPTRHSPVGDAGDPRAEHHCPALKRYGDAFHLAALAGQKVDAGVGRRTRGERQGVRAGELEGLGGGDRVESEAGHVILPADQVGVGLC
jgi:hypothetical protein